MLDTSSWRATKKHSAGRSLPTLALHPRKACDEIQKERRDETENMGYLMLLFSIKEVCILPPVPKSSEGPSRRKYTYIFFISSDTLVFIRILNVVAKE